MDGTLHRAPGKIGGRTDRADTEPGTSRAARPHNGRLTRKVPGSAKEKTQSAPQLGGHQLGQLDGVEGRALAQVVPHGEELQAVARREGLVSA